MLCQIELTPGNGQELAAAEDLTDGTRGVVIGDRTFWAPVSVSTSANMAFSSSPLSVAANRTPWRQLSRDLSRWRYRIDTLFGQLVERTTIKRI